MRRAVGRRPQKPDTENFGSNVSATVQNHLIESIQSVGMEQSARRFGTRGSSGSRPTTGGTIAAPRTAAGPGKTGSLDRAAALCSVAAVEQAQFTGGQQPENAAMT